MNSDELFEKMRAEARERHARSIRQQQEAFARREANEKGAARGPGQATRAVGRSGLAAVRAVCCTEEMNMTDFGKEPIGASIITQANEKAEKAGDRRRETLHREDYPKISHLTPLSARYGLAGMMQVEALWQEAEREADQWIAAQLARD